MTYWGMDEYQVEDVMTEFLKKSLAQSEFDPMLDSYVFSIHDLQLEYLKNHDPRHCVSGVFRMWLHKARRSSSV